MADLLIIPFGWGGMLSHFLFQNKMPCLSQIKITDGKGEHYDDTCGARQNLEALKNGSAKAMT